MGYCGNLSSDCQAHGDDEFQPRHAKQFKRRQRQLRLLRSKLDRIIRDIRRTIEGRPRLRFPLVAAAPARLEALLELECIGKATQPWRPPS